MTATTITPETPSAPSPATDADEARARGFYDRLRRRIRSFADGRGGVAEKSLDLLLLVPDMFMLLWRLVTDGRVNGRNKVLLGTGIAYYFFPMDIIPEMILGPIGFLDDLVFAVYVLNRVIADTDVEILREHWSGHEDILATIQRVLDAADNLMAGDVGTRLKSMLSRDR